MSKPNKYGWIRHRGGKCSAPELSVVEVRLRNGAVLPAHDCERFTWEHSAVEVDRQIMAYRVVDMREPVSYDDDYCDCYCDSPIQWRDRIREIDASSKEEEARHCAAMAAYDAERASLVAKLKDEGFVLIQSDEPNGVVESAQDDIAQQDMSDPANWRVGDNLIKTVGDSLSEKGYISTLTRIEGNRLYTTDQCGGDSWIHIDEIKADHAFHSRPTN